MCFEVGMVESGDLFVSAICVGNCLRFWKFEGVWDGKYISEKSKLSHFKTGHITFLNYFCEWIRDNKSKLKTILRVFHAQLAFSWFFENGMKFCRSHNEGFFMKQTFRKGVKGNFSEFSSIWSIYCRSFVQTAVGCLYYVIMLSLISI